MYVCNMIEINMLICRLFMICRMISAKQSSTPMLIFQLDSMKLIKIQNFSYKLDGSEFENSVCEKADFFGVSIY